MGFNTLGSSVAEIQHSRAFRRWDSTLSGPGFNTLGSSVAGIQHSRVFFKHLFVMVLQRKVEKKRVMRVSRLMMLSWRRAEASSASRLTTRRPETKILYHLLYLKPDLLPSKPNINKHCSPSPQALLAETVRGTGTETVSD